MSGFFRECGAVALGFARVALAIPAGILPHRVWPALQRHAPVEGLAGASALVTLFFGFLLGANGFLAYAIEETRRGTEFFLRRPDLPYVSPLAGVTYLFLFAFTTPKGLLATYVFLSGFYRVVMSILDEPRGDPLLSALWRWVTETSRRVEESQLRTERERREGPEVPDLLLTGENASVEGADYVVVASRRKPGWEAGVFVVTATGWFRLGRPFDTELRDGLRTVYPLSRLQDVEVARRRVEYELPPLTDGFSLRGAKRVEP